MIEHGRYAELIAPYVYGELSESDVHEMQKHIAICQECSEEVTDFEKIRKILDEKKKTPLQISEFTRQRILINASRRMKARRTFFRVSAISAAAMVFIGLLAGVFYMQHRDEVMMQISRKMEVRDRAAAPKSMTTKLTPPPPSASALQPMGAIDSKVDLGSNSAGKSMLPPPEQTGKKQENDIVSSTDAPAAAAPAPAFSANAKEELIRAGEERPTQLAETSRREEKGVAGGAAVTLDKKKTAPKGAQQMQSRSQEEASEEVQKSALPVAPLAFGTQTDALNMDADKQFEQQLQSASDLLAQGQKQASLDAYQKLLRRFPDREKQILQSIKDPWILDRIKHN